MNCGSPPFYYTLNTELTTYTELDLIVQRTAIDDSAGVLSDQRSAPDDLGLCSAKRDHYTYYSAQPNIRVLGNSSPANCDIYSVNYKNETCGFQLYVQVRSELLTTQKSSHGTTNLKILIDEGGILGGILFFTWFFGIFVV